MIFDYSSPDVDFIKILGFVISRTMRIFGTPLLKILMILTFP